MFYYLCIPHFNSFYLFVLWSTAEFVRGIFPCVLTSVVTRAKGLVTPRLIGFAPQREWNQKRALRHSVDSTTARRGKSLYVPHFVAIHPSVDTWVVFPLPY